LAVARADRGIAEHEVRAGRHGGRVAADRHRRRPGRGLVVLLPRVQHVDHRHDDRDGHHRDEHDQPGAHSGHAGSSLRGDQL
jgi:hypothetical protein